MNMKNINVNRIDFFITTICNLHCKLCISRIPYIENSCHFDTTALLKEIDLLFEVVDHGKIFQFMGGEPLLHPDYCVLFEKILKYGNQYDEFRITTNGKLMPRKEVLDIVLRAAKENRKIKFVISDYGILSASAQKLADFCREYGIDCRVDKYHGNSMYFNGWVDCGDFKQYGDSEYGRKNFEMCGVTKEPCLDVGNGKLYCCSREFIGAVMNKIPIPANSRVDLNSTMPISEKRVLLSGYNNSPFFSCAYCKGMCETSQRFTPAEQL
jgi:hypothetical protein